MRVIAGKFRRRQLKSLRGLALRPTSDRLRETLFNVLSAFVEGSRFLDIFAGTGAVGIEAVSRGSSEVVFLENHAPAAKLIRENLAALGIRTGFRVVVGDALRSLASLAEQHKAAGPAFDLAFLDPPYAAKEEYLAVSNFLGASTLLSPSAIVVAEHSRTLELPETVGSLQRYRVLRQGDASLTFYKKSKLA